MSFIMCVRGFCDFESMIFIDNKLKMEITNNLDNGNIRLKSANIIIFISSGLVTCTCMCSRFLLICTKIFKYSVSRCDTKPLRNNCIRMRFKNIVGDHSLNFCSNNNIIHTFYNCYKVLRAMFG